MTLRPSVSLVQAVSALAICSVVATLVPEVSSFFGLLGAPRCSIRRRGPRVHVPPGRAALRAGATVATMNIYIFPGLMLLRESGALGKASPGEELLHQ